MSKRDEHATEHAHRGPRWGRIFLVLVLLFIVAAFVGHWVWGRGAAGRLENQVAAYKAAGEPTEPLDFVVTGVADADNAVLDLRAAAAAIQNKTPSYKRYNEMESTDFPLREKEIDILRKMLAENGGVFDHVARATTKSGIDWKLNFSASPAITILLPDLNQQRELANLLAADAVIAHHDGDDARAVKRLDQILFISRANAKQPFIVCHLVSVGLAALASDRAASMGIDLRVAGKAMASASPNAATREQVDSLIKRLLDEQPVKESQRMGLLGERMAQLDATRNLVSGRINLNQLTSPGGRGAGAAANVLASVAGYAFRPSFTADGLMMIQQTTALMNAAQGSADYPAFKANAPTMPAALVNAKPWQHVFARIMMPSLDRSVLTAFRSSADRRITATSLAIRLYALDHDGQLPPTLDALVPNYLASVPADPFASGAAPLRYIPDANRPVVYSIGENGADDGGSRAPYQTRRPEPGPWEQMDYVFDLKRQPRPAPTREDDATETPDEEMSEPPDTGPGTPPQPDAAPTSNASTQPSP